MVRPVREREDVARPHIHLRLHAGEVNDIANAHISVPFDNEDVNDQSH